MRLAQFGWCAVNCLNMSGRCVFFPRIPEIFSFSPGSGPHQSEEQPSRQAFLPFNRPCKKHSLEYTGLTYAKCHMWSKMKCVSNWTRTAHNQLPHFSNQFSHCFLITFICSIYISPFSQWTPKEATLDILECRCGNLKHFQR